MATIPLRTYNHEIEQLIEKGYYDQAIAHCKHILKQFPKHIDTYRLLGKAYLESQRYGDASDIFQRVLSSIPEDFVSHIGMSIIREDEGNLDEAIWHMERAFEMQPANSAVQGELKRLFGRRDGVEPPKINLTRCALARMYLKGGLYDQAIAEIRIALAENADRLDLQALLSRAYYMAGQYAEAVDVCRTLLSKLPYCLDANTILADLTTKDQGAEETTDFRNRLITLNPYFSHVSSDNPSPDMVSEDAITIEKLEWEPGMEIGANLEQPAWANSLGVDLDESKKEQVDFPDWLQSPEEANLEENEPSIQPISSELPDFLRDTTPESATDEMKSISSEQPSQESIPDWMKEAGWESSQNEAEKIPPAFIPDEGVDVDHLEPAVIPDWLKSLAPTDLEENQPIPEQETAEESQLPWLEESSTEPAESIAGLVQDQEKQPVEQSDGTQPSVISDSSEVSEELPDWLAEMSDKSGIESAYQSETEIQEMTQQPVEPEETLIEPSVESEKAEDIPEWLKEMINETDASTTNLDETPLESMTPGEQTETEQPDWLQAKSVEADVKSEVIETTAQQEPEKMEVGETPESGDTQPVQIIPEKPAEPEPSVELPPEETEVDLTWLEGLTEKQVLDEAELLEPEVLKAESTDKLEELSEEVEVPDVEPQKEEQEPTEVTSIEPSLSDLEQFTATSSQEGEEGQTDLTTAEEKKRKKTLTDWLNYTREISEEPELTSLASEEELTDWLTEEQEESPSPQVSIEEVEDKVVEKDEEKEEIEFQVGGETEAKSEIPGWVSEYSDQGVEPNQPELSEESIPEISTERFGEVPESTEWPSDFEKEQSEITSINENLPGEVTSTIEEEMVGEDSSVLEEEPGVEEEILPVVAEEIVEPSFEAEPFEPVNLNSDSISELEKISGIGFTLAQAIIDYRETHGPFYRLEDLMNISGIGPVLIEEIRDKIYMEKEPPQAAKPMDEYDSYLLKARDELKQGLKEEALIHYDLLIKSRQYIPDVISDLTTRLSQFPLDIPVWTCLGDAYIRSDQLDAALEAYNKAEELLR
jgi:competence ComEA-like helix-hairpin-helix protein